MARECTSSKKVLAQFHHVKNRTGKITWEKKRRHDRESSDYLGESKRICEETRKRNNDREDRARRRSREKKEKIEREYQYCLQIACSESKKEAQKTGGRQHNVDTSSVKHKKRTSRF